MSAGIRRVLTNFESSPASCPTRSTSALTGDVVVVSEVVSVVAVPGIETAVFVLCTGGAPSASVSAGLTRVRHATDCVVSLDVVSWLGDAASVVVLVSGSSGKFEMCLWNRSQNEFTVAANLQSASRAWCQFLCGGRSRQTSPYSFWAECAGC